MLPRFTPEEQRLCLALYRQLAQGNPVSRASLAAVLGAPEPAIAAALSGESLQGLVYYDDARRIIGFGGLAIVPMHHRIRVDGRVLYTWCAWDSLFVPAMLGTTVHVESTCPQSGETIRVTVRPEAIAATSHPDAVVSFLVPEALGGDAHKTMASFCHYVFFFATPAAGTAWTARHDGTFLLSLNQAFELGRRKNAAQFPEALGHLK